MSLSNIRGYIETTDKRKARNPDIRPDKFYLPNRIGYVDFIHNEYKRYSMSIKDADKPVADADDDTEIIDVSKSAKLSKPQQFVRDYLFLHSPYRGILLYHGLGVGKTAASIAAAEILMVEKRAFILSPAKLEGNYLKEIKLWGHNAYSVSQHWQNIAANKLDKGITSGFISDKLLRKHGRLWYAVADKPANYSSLSEGDRTEIIAQIDDIIRNKFTFVHFDNPHPGELKRLVAASSSGNPFDNAVVVIDEVHNLISTVSGDEEPVGPVKKGIYKLLFDAKNTKLVLLSATPIINKPSELSKLVNLLKGRIELRVVQVKGNITDIELKKIEEIAMKNNRVDYFNYDPLRRRFEFIILPPYFVNSEKTRRVHYDASADTDSAEIENELIRNIKDIGATLSADKFTSDIYYPLPNDNEEFDNYFIDYEKNKIKNRELFMRRILGSVSYVRDVYDEYGATITDHKLHYLDMTDDQWALYYGLRMKEKRQERVAASRDKGELAIQTFKNDTRIACNFVYPKERTTIDKLIGAREGYLRLRDNGDKSREHYLERYSPKFAEIIKNVRKSPGTALVYSQYREKGVDVFTAALCENGYIEFRISKNDGKYKTNITRENRDMPKYIEFGKYSSDIDAQMMRVFNNKIDDECAVKDELERIYGGGHVSNLRGEIARIFIITKGGAEGISLYNVRQVHLIEPFWNNIRSEQVIGRAKRLQSHRDLPERDRNFVVFEYMMKFSDRLIKKDKSISELDNGKTTDQLIYLISQRKKELNRQFLDALKSAAIDCKLHKAHHPEVTCFSPSGTPDSIITSPILLPVSEYMDATMIKKKYDAKVVNIRGEKYIFIREKGKNAGGQLFDYSDYTNHGSLKEVGKIAASKEGKLSVTLY
jgi:hypothetical protein